MRTPIGKPDTKPEATYQVDIGGFHRVNAFYKQQPDEDGVSRRGKPEGVARVVVAYMIIESPAEGEIPVDITSLNPDDFPKIVSGTRSPIKVAFLAGDKGKTVAIAMCWETERGIRGDWSPVQAITIP